MFAHSTGAPRGQRDIQYKSCLIGTYMYVWGKIRGHVAPGGKCFTIFGHDLCHCFLATVRVFLVTCTYHNFPCLMDWHSDKSLLAVLKTVHTEKFVC